MRDFGAPQAQIDAYKAANKPKHCEVLAENWQALAWFLSVDDLFRIEQGTVIGLDIQAIHADAQMRGLEIDPTDYEKLRTIGRVAASELNKLSE